MNLIRNYKTFSANLIVFLSKFNSDYTYKLKDHSFNIINQP